MISIKPIISFILAALALLCFSAIGQTETIYNSWNTNPVENGPTCSAFFTTDKQYRITYIDTYHSTNGQGASGEGTISLENGAGDVYGPWAISSEVSQDGSNVMWIVRPDEVIPAGAYIISDSDPDTWLRNSESPCGFAKVEGSPVSKNTGDLATGEETQNKGLVRAFVTVDGDCRDNPIEVLVSGCDKGMPDIPVELTFTYIPPEYSAETPENIREITDSNGMAEFNDVPAGSRFKLKTSIKTMEKELEGTMPDDAEKGVQLNFDYTCKGQLLGNTYYPCGYQGVQCSPECQLYPL